jgi:hypothetical protein
MKRLVFGVLFYLMAVSFGSRVLAAPFPTELKVPDTVGVNIHFVTAQPGEMEMLTAAGFRWVRMDCDWAEIEKTKGHYDFSAFDKLVPLCESNHVRLMAIFDYASPFYDGNVSPHTDEGIAAFVNWSVATVKHFKGHHILWEMYNEPNGFWKPHPDVNAYIKLALAVGKAIKAAAPEELFCGPALSGTDSAWLEPCFKSGLLEYWDAVTVHPYGDEPPESRATHYQGVRALLERYSPKGKSIPLLSGEWGYTAARVSREMQGKLLARQILFNLASNIPLSIWYDWRDDGPDPKDGEQNFGLVANAYHKEQTPVLEPKPAYLAAKTLTSELDGFTFSKRVALPESKDFVLLFSKGPEVRAAVWTTSNKAHAVTIPWHKGNVSVVDWTGHKLPDIQSDEKSVTIELSDGARYLR